MGEIDQLSNRTNRVTLDDEPVANQKVVKRTIPLEAGLKRGLASQQDPGDMSERPLKKHRDTDYNKMKMSPPATVALSQRRTAILESMRFGLEDPAPELSEVLAKAAEVARSVERLMPPPKVQPPQGRRRVQQEDPL